jgi:hypothetical protein
MSRRRSLLHCGWRQSLFLLATAGLLVLCTAIQFHWTQGKAMWQVILFSLLLPICLAVTFTWPQNSAPRAHVAGLLLLALLARLALLPHPGDSDANRYLWEGRLIRLGQDPYAHVASASEWSGLRDAYWQGMNQKDLRAIYSIHR